MQVWIDLPPELVEKMNAKDLELNLEWTTICQSALERAVSGHTTELQIQHLMEENRKLKQALKNLVNKANLYANLLG